MIELIKEIIKKGAGCTIGEYIAAVNALKKIKPLNLLVFSCGMDSILWEKLADTVIFIEDNQKWADRISKEIHSEIKVIKYNTKVIDGMKYLSNSVLLDLSCLDCLIGFNPNAIFIDGPIGYGSGPGRAIPITWSSLQENIELILVHDFNRVIERNYSTILFKDKYKLEIQVEKIGIFTKIDYSNK